MSKEKVIRFECEICEGKGWVEEWKYKNKYLSQKEELEIKDCRMCNGKGYLMLKVKDLREKSKKMKLKHKYESLEEDEND